MGDETLTIFRKYKDKNPPWYGDVVALFPEEKAHDPYCVCYQRVGQHGSADYGYVISITEKATPYFFIAS